MSYTIEREPPIANADPKKIAKAERFLRTIEGYLNYRYDLPEGEDWIREDAPGYNLYMCKTGVITGAMQYIQMLADSGLFPEHEKLRLEQLAIRMGEITKQRRVGILTPKDKEDQAMKKVPEDMQEIKQSIQEVVRIGRAGLERYSESIAA